MNNKKIEKCIYELWTYHEGLVNKKEFTDKDCIKHLYENIAELLLKKGYAETSIENIFGTRLYKELNYNTDTDTDFELITEITNNFYETLNKEDNDRINNDENFIKLMYDLTEYIKKLIDKEPEKDTKDKIIKLLTSINEAERIPPTSKKRLIELLETELNLFSVDVEDNKLKNGYRRKYYQIDNKSNTYKEINRGLLQQYINKEYKVKLHETPNFYEDVLDRINTLKEVNDNYLEFENVYIDKRNYNIIDKTKLPDVFTEDRVYYEEYNTNNLKLFRYDKDINLYDVLKHEVKPSLAMDTFIKIFVPRTKPEDIRLLQYILQTIGMMVIGRNPAKRITVLYDETETEKDRIAGDSGKSTARKIIQEIFKNGNSDLNDKTLNDNFLINSIAQAKHFLFMDELRGNELKEFIHILKRLSSGYDFDGRKTYSDKQDSVNVPPILITMNGVPELPLNDKTYLGRYVLAKAPNVFKPVEEVNPNKNEYPEISNIIDQIKEDSQGLSQLISIAINEYITLDQEKSIKNQLSLNPSIEETIAITSKSDIVLGILKAYTSAGARTSDKNSWVSISELKNTIKQVFKKSNKKEINPDLITNQKIGYKLVELYPNLLNKENNKNNRKRYNGHYVYNITLYTNEEMNNKLSEIIIAKPETPDKKIFDEVQKAIHNKIMNGVDTEAKLYHEFEDIYSTSEIEDALEELYQYDLIEYSNTLNFIE